MTPPPKTAAQIRAERLAKALKACKRKRNKQKRVACERGAHKKYAGAKVTKASNSRRGK